MSEYGLNTRSQGGVSSRMGRDENQDGLGGIGVGNGYDGCSVLYGFFYHRGYLVRFLLRAVLVCLSVSPHMSPATMLSSVAIMKVLQVLPLLRIPPSVASMRLALDT